MTRYVNEQIEAKIQVLDSLGNPATSATVHYNIYDYADELVDSGLMSHVANGIYTVSFTPNAVGEWTFEAYCSNPKFRDSRVYNVEYSYHLPSLQTPVVQLVSGVIQNQVIELVIKSVPGMLHMLEFEQTNNEAGVKDIGFHVMTDDYSAAGKVAAVSGTKYYLFIGSDGALDLSAGTLALANGKTSSFGYHTLYVWVQLLSVPGTNQHVNGYVSYDQFGRPEPPD